MAKTLKFGENGIWATKTGSSMAYNDQNGNFKPAPFSVTRDSIATRVNKQGLIEVVGKDKLRIDYKDSSNGVALLEPARTNLLPYSTLVFNGDVKPTGWSIGFGTGTYSHQEVTYKGQGAVKHTQITTGRSYLDTGALTLVAGVTYTFKMQLDLDNCTLSPTTEVLSVIGFTTNFAKTFSDVDSDGVLSFQFETGVDNTGNIRIGLGANGNAEGGQTITFSMPQLEAGSYPTSYIPTSGSTYERKKDVARGAGNEQVFNDSEGVLFANIAAIDDAETNNRRLGLTKNNTFEGLRIQYDNSTIGAVLYDGSTNQYSRTFTFSDLSLFAKVAFKYKASDFALWINGFEYGTQASGTTLPDGTLNDLSFDYVNGNFFFGKTKEVGYYDTALTDAELEALTSYTSFTNMANELNLTIK